jgi:glycerol-3-phosphate acyltransferase PlsY
MEFLITILFSILGYLLGSISFSRIFLKILAPDKSIDEIRVEVDDYEGGFDATAGYGANKASMILGTKWGIFIGICDMMKVILPLIIVRIFIFPTETYYLYIAAFGLVGHNYPIYHRFKGGRGMSVLFGSLIIIDWLGAILVPILGLLLGFTLTGSLSFASIAWIWLMIPWFIFRTFDINFFVYAIIINIVFMVGLIPEMRLYFKLRKEGKIKEYRENIVKSSGYLRGMKKLEDFFNSLGIWRIVLGICILIATITILLFLKALPI